MTDTNPTPVASDAERMAYLVQHWPMTRRIVSYPHHEGGYELLAGGLALAHTDFWRIIDMLIHYLPNGPR